MTYIFYKDLIAELAIDLNYKSVVHLLARDYSDESVVKHVEDQNPFMVSLNIDKPNKETNKNSAKKVTLGSLQQLGML